MIVFLCLLFAVCASPAATGLVAKCNNDTNINGITAEGGVLNCSCGTQAPSGSSRYYWHGHPGGAILLVSNVSRAQNGTVYTCVKETPGQANETATHTLLVAYGPSDNDTTITVRSSSNTGDRKLLTLECVAQNVYPPPLYGWPNRSQCTNTSACTISPKATDNGNKVFCTATNRALGKTGTGVYTINVTVTSIASSQKPPSGHLLLMLLLFTSYCMGRSWNFTSVCLR